MKEPLKHRDWFASKLPDPATHPASVVSISVCPDLHREMANFEEEQMPAYPVEVVTYRFKREYLKGLFSWAYTYNDQIIKVSVCGDSIFDVVMYNITHPAGYISIIDKHNKVIRDLQYIITEGRNTIKRLQYEE